jgi:hypothetical protein
MLACLLSRCQCFHQTAVANPAQRGMAHSRCVHAACQVRACSLACLGWPCWPCFLLHASRHGIAWCLALLAWVGLAWVSGVECSSCLFFLSCCLSWIRLLLGHATYLLAWLGWLCGPGVLSGTRAHRQARQGRQASMAWWCDYLSLVHAMACIDTQTYAHTMRHTDIRSCEHTWTRSSSEHSLHTHIQTYAYIHNHEYEHTHTHIRTGQHTSVPAQCCQCALPQCTSWPQHATQRAMPQLHTTQVQHMSSHPPSYVMSSNSSNECKSRLAQSHTPVGHCMVLCSGHAHATVSWRWRTPAQQAS